MGKKILALSAILFMLLACKSKKSAFNYNQQIVEMEKSLESAITSTESKVGSFISTEKYDSVAIAGQKMVDLVQEKIDKIEKDPAPNVKEGENFKTASLKYFKFIRNIYSEYVKIGKAKTDTERMTVYKDIEDAVKDKSKIISDMQGAQRKYAAANGFKVQ